MLLVRVARGRVLVRGGLQLVRTLATSAVWRGNWQGQSFSALGRQRSGSCCCCWNGLPGMMAKRFCSDEEDAFEVELDPEPVPDVWPHVPVIALRRAPSFPLFMDIIELRNPLVMDLVRSKIMQGEPYVGLFLKRVHDSAEELVASLDEIYQVGTFGLIEKIQDSSEMLRLMVVGQRRIRITGQLEPPKATPAAPESVLIAVVENVQTPAYETTEELTAIRLEMIRTLQDLTKANAMYKKTLRQVLHHCQRVVDDPVYLCDLAAVLSVSGPEELQKVLEETDVPKRMMQSLLVLKTDLEAIKLESKIQREVEENVEKHHRRTILREQLKIVKRELGLQLDDKEAIVAKYRAKLQDKVVPENIGQLIDGQLGRLRTIECSCQEFNLIRNYLDWLTALPWGVSSTDNLCMEHASEILDHDHYGMEDVKRRILEFVAVSALRGSTQGRILCFHGPPGVGKTSIAKSIARALNRKYFRFSVGGLTDVAEIKGHRRSYVGALPGKVIHCLRTTNTENPLVLIDEVDKIGKGPQGNPCAALLELFDSEQSASFLDNFLDVPIDLSRVLFICTANWIDRIPEPLRDRMEMVEVAGYVPEEKLFIARQYLVPQSMGDCGLSPQQLSITESALQLLIHRYCREAGVRHLRQQIEKIIRKVALQLVRRQCTSCHVNADNLCTFLGGQTFATDRLYERTPPGVALALAMGGSSLYIETTRLATHKPPTADVSGTLHTTGSLGAVMQESAQIALTVARNFMHQRHPGNHYLQLENIHLHVPEGAVPKDDPSAGVSIVTAFVSLATNRCVRDNLAMTGEISLRGKVLPVTGIKQKAIAARRSGINCVILPADNRRDFEELPAFITAGLEVHFAANYEDVYRIAFDEPNKNEHSPREPLVKPSSLDA
ncbi:lon protease homolog, mitochondrial-like [Drosophila subobscura]|uniref:lon protease homolog, mitochondrial-like n=1 Tax=Drosophila subobscura TaxID=7241 RepID=UPI00155A5957|nr:lon protease homolog, mitochondrial-like [Drosophila subobscura]